MKINWILVDLKGIFIKGFISKIEAREYLSQNSGDFIHPVLFSARDYYRSEKINGETFADFINDIEEAIKNFQ